MPRINAKEGLGITPTTEPSNNNTVYIDSADNALKVKNNSGVVEEIPTGATSGWELIASGDIGDGTNTAVTIADNLDGEDYLAFKIYVDRPASSPDNRQVHLRVNNSSSAYVGNAVVGNSTAASASNIPATTGGGIMLCSTDSNVCGAIIDISNNGTGHCTITYQGFGDDTRSSRQGAAVYNGGLAIDSLELVLRNGSSAPSAFFTSTGKYKVLGFKG